MQRIEASGRRPFAVAVVEVSPTTVRLRAEGEVDLATAPLLESALMAQLDAAGLRYLDVDLAGLLFLDARGIAALLGVAHAARRAGCRLRLLAPPAHIRRVLEITGVPTVCDVI